MDLKERIKKAKKRVKMFELKPDNLIVGILKEVRTFTIKGKERKMYIIENEDDGEEYGIWETSVLAGEFEKNQVLVGDRVAVKYLGIPEGKNYHDWYVLKDMGND